MCNHTPQDQHHVEIKLTNPGAFGVILVYSNLYVSLLVVLPVFEQSDLSLGSLFSSYPNYGSIPSL